MIPKRLKYFDLFVFLRRASKPALILICTLFMILVMVIDWLSGPDLSSSIFYLLPISLAAWFINRRTGLAFSVLSAALWFMTDYLTHPNLTGWVIFWNATVRLGFFLIVVFSLAALRRSRQRQEDLMAFVVHDLRAPLGNMLTALDLLKASEHIGEQDSTWNELITLGISSGRRMLVLVDALLDLSRLESGGIQVNKESVLLAGLFTESISQVVLTAEIKHVTIEPNIKPQGTAVFADPALTQRIIVNLLNNAIKFSPQNGKIRLNAALAENSEVIVGVHDQGPGIPAEWQRRVFAKYGQVSGGKSGGSGLGLTFCKLAVEAQDGRIWLESEAGNGTTLHFSLPAAVSNE